MGRKTRNVTKQANFQSNRTAQQREGRNGIERIRILQSRATRSFQAAFSASRAVFSLRCFNLLQFLPMRCYWIYELKFAHIVRH